MNQGECRFKGNEDMCCICGNGNCFESVDHARIGISELKTLIRRGKSQEEEIDEVKAKVKSTYDKIKMRFLEKIEKD